MPDYDYIIVGRGSSGYVMASRLGEVLGWIAYDPAINVGPPDQFDGRRRERFSGSPKLAAALCKSAAKCDEPEPSARARRCHPQSSLRCLVHTRFQGQPQRLRLWCERRARTL